MTDFAHATVITGQIDLHSDLTAGMITRVIWALGQTAVSLSLSHQVIPCQTRVPNRGWQMFLPIEVEGLREALALQASAIAVAGPDLNLRLCVGNGDAEFTTEGDINSARGSAFVSSGRLLDAKKSRRIDHADPFLSRGVFRDAEKICVQWNTTQAQVMQVVLDPKVNSIAAAAKILDWDEKTLRSELRLAQFDQIKDTIGLRDFDREDKQELMT